MLNEMQSELTKVKIMKRKTKLKKPLISLSIFTGKISFGEANKMFVNEFRDFAKYSSNEQHLYFNITITLNNVNVSIFKCKGKCM